jgi:hypothetical protein
MAVTINVITHAHVGIRRTMRKAMAISCVGRNDTASARVVRIRCAGSGVRKLETGNWKLATQAML